MSQAKNDRVVWVVGHKNPDTDAVCSAISYAYLKNQTDEGTFVPKKAGELNGETKYVLDHFQVEVPETITGVGTQIKDIALRYSPGVSQTDSIKTAWETMRSLDVVTLPVVDANQKLSGLVTSDDIARSYMNVYDNNLLSNSRTQYKSIIETLNGHLWAGNSHAFFSKGKVVVASGDREAMRREIDVDDMVIMGNAWEHQIIALMENPSCLIICGVDNVEDSIIEQANKQDTVVITTGYDTFTTARLIHQSIPIRYFMTRGRDIIKFQMDDYLDDVTERLTKIRHRDFPIVDEQLKYVAMFSRRLLLSARKKQIILVDHNEKSQAVDGIEEADILEIIDHHRLGNLETISPIFFRNQPLGCSCTIIYQMYQEKGVEIPQKIAGLMCSAILSDTLMFRSPTCTPVDVAAAKALAAIADIDIEKHATAMFEEGSNFNGKSPEDIIFTDFKTFNTTKVNFGVSQVSSVSRKQLATIKPKLQEYLENVLVEKNLQMVFVLLTNIFDQSSELIYAGNNAAFTVEDAFGKDCMTEDSAILKGVVSRKKQVVPAIIESIQRHTE